MTTDLLLLLGLILLNGVFAMAEISLVSSRRARLVQMVADKAPGAQRALRLSEDPTRFLSTVQVGITSIGILSGAVGEGAIADRLRVGLETMPVLAPYAHGISVVLMVVTLTYVSLILGELVPKRLGLTSPERIAALVAGPMHVLATIGRPLVTLLGWSTELVLKVLRISSAKGPSVSHDEIDHMMKQGHAEGVFEEAEATLVSNVLDLDERHVGAILTPRSDVVHLDLMRPFEANRAILAEDPHSILPLCRGTLDDIVGFVRANDVLRCLLRDAPVDLEALAHPASFVPKTMSLMALLAQFRQSHLPVVLVVDEFGVVVGLATLTDVMAAIVGHLPETADGGEAIVKRADGSLLVDGTVEIVTLETLLGVEIVTDDERRHFHTVGGLVMAALARIPKTGDRFERGGHAFEIVDMDGHRVDRVLIGRVEQ